MTAPRRRARRPRRATTHRLKKVAQTYLERVEGKSADRIVKNHDARLLWAAKRHGLDERAVHEHEDVLRGLIAKGMGVSSAAFQEDVVRAQTIQPPRPRMA